MYYKEKNTKSITSEKPRIAQKNTRIQKFDSEHWTSLDAKKAQINHLKIVTKLVNKKIKIGYTFFIRLSTFRI